MRRPARAAAPRPRRDSLPLRLAAFTALAAFGAAHWAGLVGDRAGGAHLLVVLVVAVGGAAALAALGRAPLAARRACSALAALVGAR